MRNKHIEFIHNDTKERGETMVGGIIFLGALYHLMVRKDHWKRSKKVKYSAGKTILNGYREIPATIEETIKTESNE